MTSRRNCSRSPRSYASVTPARAPARAARPPCRAARCCDHQVVRQGAGAVFHVDPRQAEQLHRPGDLRRDRLGRPDAERTMRAGFAVELLPRGRRPAAFPADACDHRLVVRPQLLLRQFVGGGHVSRRMHGYRALGLPQLLERLVIEVDEWLEPLRAAADDRERERQAVARGADDRLGTAADTDPGAQRPALDWRIDDLAAAGARASIRSTSRRRGLSSSTKSRSLSSNSSL